MLIVGESLLRDTEAPILQPDRESQEVCCLPELRCEMLPRVPQLVKSTGYPLLHFHMGTNYTSQNLARIKEDYKALGVRVKNINAQVTFLPVRGKGSARNRCILQINFWPHG